MVRLPLIHEFEGICHAGQIDTSAEQPFKFCNHGYAKGHCASFPESVSLSAVRFSVVSRTDSSFTVVVVEEEDHWPRSWSSFEFVIQDGRIVPAIEDNCRRAQVFQFCLSYLDTFHSKAALKAAG